MSATYNWAYKPGVTNKYDLTVPTSADNIRPTGWCYVALFGNDATGNGSRQLPYKTITKACTIPNVTIVLGSGVYRELAPISGLYGHNFIGDGNAVIDISYIESFSSTDGNSSFVYNIHLRGNGVSSYFTTAYTINTTYRDVHFDGCFLTSNGGNNPNTFIGCIISNFSGLLLITGGAASKYQNTTFVNCNNIQLQGSHTLIDMCIFYYCNISNSTATTSNIQYSLLFSCNLNLGAVSNGGVLYPTIPPGYTYYSAIADLRSAWSSLFGGPSFLGCVISNPLFNNPVIGDFTLSFNSPAKNLSYWGTYVGAKSIAYSIKASTSESNGSFEFNSATNLIIADDSITLINSSLDAKIETNVIINSLGREIANFPFYGFNADRNGQYIDSIADLDAVTKLPGDMLAIPSSYLVENGAVIYNGVSYTAGTRFTTVADQTSFTTSSGGVLREILEAPQRNTIMARFSDGGINITAGTSLVIGYYYYVQSGSVLYNDTIYDSGKIFKAVDANSFSGSANVIIAFSTETYQHYEPGVKPTSNNIGDSRTGVIVRGNGDPAYIRGGFGVQEFPINAKFIQIGYYIKVNNLKP